jgi:hypothetical protein
MSNWAILSGIEGNLAAYEAVLEDIKRQTLNVTEIFILGDVINANPESEKVIKRIQHPRTGELTPQVCKGWWEEQLLMLHGYAQPIEPNPLMEKYGAATAKKLWDSISRETVQWISDLHFGFMELDCLLTHGSSINVLEELTPQSSPLQLFDRVMRTQANRLFCGRSGQTFRYQIKDGSVNSSVMTLDGVQPLETVQALERYIIGVGNVGRNLGKATYTLYNSGSDLLKFRSVNYGHSRGFGKV